MSTYQHQLDRSELLALRFADALAFVGNGRKYDDGPRGSFIRATVRGDRSGTGFEQARFIDCEPALLRVYNPDREGFPPEEEAPRAACVVITSARFEPVVQTMLAHLRVGDALQLEVDGGDTSEVVRETRLTVDRALLRVHRPQKDGTSKVFAFLLATQVGKVGSPIRMIYPVQGRAGVLR